MSHLFKFITLLAITACAHKKADFISHKGEGKWSNYLTMNLPFLPYAQKFKEILIKEKRRLTSRGEAHITVITPPEYWILSEKMTIDEINQIALDMNIQKSHFKELCLGSFEKVLDNKLEKTFYLVVESEDLMNIRKKVESVFKSRRGEGFDANKYYPHITLGFTKRDFHESDGAVKDSKSCFQ